MAFHGRYDKEENELCRTCHKRIERFITSIYIRGSPRGYTKSWAPKRKRMDDVKDWAKLPYGEVKRAAEERERWRLMVVNLRYEVDK